MIETYRGYNSQYANYGVPPNQKYMWTAVDEWTSLEYGDGTIVKFTIDDEKLNGCDIYDYWELFGDESDPIDIDNEIVDELKKNGYNCYWGEIANGDECICLFDNSPIVKAEIIRTPEDVDKEIQETLRISNN